MIDVLAEVGCERTVAMIVAVELGRVVYEHTAGGAMHTRAHRTLKLRVEPLDADPYEAELELSPDDPMVPARPGTRMPVLVDPADPMRLSLPEERWFVMPGGVVWTPPAPAAAW
jgi:hypothetical protein